MNWRICRLSAAAATLKILAEEFKAFGFDSEDLERAGRVAYDFIDTLRSDGGKHKRAKAINRKVARAAGEPDPDDLQKELPFAIAD